MALFSFGNHSLDEWDANLTERYVFDFAVAALWVFLFSRQATEDKCVAGGRRFCALLAIFTSTVRSSVAFRSLSTLHLDELLFFHASSH